MRPCGGAAAAGPEVVLAALSACRARGLGPAPELSPRQGSEKPPQEAGPPRAHPAQRGGRRAAAERPRHASPSTSRDRAGTRRRVRNRSWPPSSEPPTPGARPRGGAESRRHRRAGPRGLGQVRIDAAQIVAEARSEADAIRRQAAEAGARPPSRRSSGWWPKERPRPSPPCGRRPPSCRRTEQAWLSHWETAAVRLRPPWPEKIIRRELRGQPQITLTLVRERWDWPPAAPTSACNCTRKTTQAGCAGAALMDAMAAVGGAEVTADPTVRRAVAASRPASARSTSRSSPNSTDEEELKAKFGRSKYGGSNLRETNNLKGDLTSDHPLSDF